MAESSAEGGGVFLSSDVDLDVRLKVRKHFFLQFRPLHSLFFCPQRRSLSLGGACTLLNIPLKVSLFAPSTVAGCRAAWTTTDGRGITLFVKNVVAATLRFVFSTRHPSDPPPFTVP
jgi:hypothetical protein